MIEKKNIYVDMFQQNKEKNIWMGDFPLYNYKTGRQLKSRFRDYFNTLDEYFSSKNEKYSSWTEEYKHTSQEAYKFFRDVQDKEYRNIK